MRLDEIRGVRERRKPREEGIKEGMKQGREIGRRNEEKEGN